jgi:hypothetical protein
MWRYVSWVDSGVSKNCRASIFKVMWIKKGRFPDPEDESNTILRNVGKYLLNDTASRPRRLKSSATPVRRPLIPHPITSLIPVCCSRELLLNVTESVTTTPSVAEIPNCYSGHLRRRTPEIATGTTTGLPTTAFKQHCRVKKKKKEFQYHLKDLLLNNLTAYYI